MKGLNKFLVVFAIFFTVFSAAAWKFLQSKYVSTILSEYINKNLILDEKMNLSFSRVSGGFFPPRTILENVKFKVQDGIEVQMKDVSASFSLFSLFSSDVKFSSVNFEDGFISIPKLAKNSNSNDEVDLFKTLNNITSQLPFQISRIEVRNSDFFLEESGVNIPIKSLALSPYELSYDIIVDVERVQWEGIEIDNLFLDAEIVEDSIRLRNGYLFVKDSKISGSGKIELDSKKIHAEVDYKLNFDSFFTFLQKNKITLEGLVEGKVTATGRATKEELFLNGNINGVNLASVYAQLDKLSSDFSYTNNKLDLKKTRGEVNNGYFSFKNNLSLNFKQIQVIQSNTNILANRLHLNDILYFLGDEFKLLKGRVSGEVSLSMDTKGNVLVDKNETSDFSIDNLALKPRHDDIIKLNKLKINKLKIAAGKEFRISTNGSLNKANLEISGSVIGKQVDFVASTKELELNDLGGDIAEIAKGRGDFNIEVKGGDDVIIGATTSNVKKLDIYGFTIPGKSKASIRYSLNDSRLYVDEILNISSGAIRIKGLVDISRELINLGIDLNQIDINSLQRNIKPIWNDIRPYLEPVAGIFNGNVKLTNKFSNIETHVNVSSDKVSVYSEPLDSLALELNVDNRKVSITNLLVKKNTSSISASTVYDFKNGFEEISLITTPIKLTDLYRYRDLGLGYNGYFSTSIKAKKNGVLKGSGSAYLTSTKIGNINIGSSGLEYSFTDRKISFKTNILKDDVQLSGNLDLSKKLPKIDLTYQVDIPNIKNALSFLSEHNSFNNELNGFAQLNGKIAYDFNAIEPVTFIANINQFHINNYGRDLTLKRPYKIEIVNSEIKNLDFNLSGSGGLYNVQGKGNVDTGFEIVQDLDINLSYLTLLTSEIERVLGDLKGHGLITGNIKNFDLSHSFSTNNFGLKLKSIPLEIANAKGTGSFKDDKIYINSLSGELGSGTFELSGFLKAHFPYPELSLNGEYKNVGYQVESRSVINTDGKLSMTGRGFPYLIKGEVFVNGGLVENEFNDFKSTSEYNKSLNKYITQTNKGIPDLVNLDIDLSVKETVRLRNRLADLLIAGDLSVEGQFTNPTLEGQLIIVPGLSKFKFRGNDFMLSEGLVYFTRNENLDPISLNLLANSTIGQYDIEMGITGSVEDISINLESNPYLSRDNIFSLLTLGVTSDFSQNLEDSQRTSLTTIGIGTFLVDQLNINEGLDSALGLKLSVLPEFSESSDSPIEEATKSEQSVKTATKLQITKKVNENVDLKFSNTFDSESNKQSINIDYSINEKLSIQGIFESEDDNNNENESDGSAGADIKYKWSF